jgi:hypothetical protein
MHNNAVEITAVACISGYVETVVIVPLCVKRILA